MSFPPERIARWQSKLLDLTLRNRLLNFRATKQTVPLECPDLPSLEDELASGRTFSIRAQSIGKPPLPPKPSTQDAVVSAPTSPAPKNRILVGSRRRDRPPRPITGADKTEAQGTRGIPSVTLPTVGDKTQPTGSSRRTRRLHARLSSDELQKRLTKLYRSSRNDLAEGGSNTLYLALGFLRWKESPRDPDTHLAPLILVPVTLKRSRGGASYALAHHDDEVRFNATLIQKLKQDFDCDLSCFEAELPRDNRGVDVPKILSDVQRAIASLAGFEVTSDCSLGLFSFSKYLMWKDLVQRSDQLLQNRVVRHLVLNPDQPFLGESDPSPVDPSALDDAYEPGDLVFPLDADSSQLAAVMSASRGSDFVLLGPPGTGKSQTIANMIAQCLAAGKSVLFVAEKTAALNVVQRRMDQIGLGDLCVELHSNKAERKRFLNQLDRSWRNGRRVRASRWKSINKKLAEQQTHLNAYVEHLHQPNRNGSSAFEAMGLSIKSNELPGPVFDWPRSTQHTPLQLEEMRSLATEVQTRFASVQSLLPMNAVTKDHWSIAWEQDLIEQSQTLLHGIDEVQNAFVQFCEALGMEHADTTAEHLADMERLAVMLLETAGEDFRTVFDPDFNQLSSDVDRLDADITSYDAAAAQCGARFADDRLKQIQCDELLQSWLAAEQSIWPLSYWRKRPIVRSLQALAKSGKVNLPVDLERIRELQASLQRIESNPLSARGHLWDGRQTQIGSIQKYLSRCDALRSLIDRVGTFSRKDGRGSISSRVTQRGTLSQTIMPVLRDTASEHAVYEFAQRFSSLHQSWECLLGSFESTAGRPPYEATSKQIFQDSVAMANRILEQRSQLQSWTAWQSIARRAAQLQMSPLTDGMQRGELPATNVVDSFDLGYVRWWLPSMIDGSEPLREFQAARFEEHISEFRRLDRAARQEAVRQIRKAVGHELPLQSSVPRKSELGRLRHQIGLKRPSKAIRELIEGMPESFPKLARCMLMSPLSIAQYLPIDQEPFDVVIFDEASQITTWDAIGAIAQGRQTIIVGDPKQLPPTNFFSRSQDDEEDEALDDFEKDLDSILDEAIAAGLPVLHLNWHYRSRHEMLIQFSNRHYYDGNLVSFPEPETTDNAVSFVFVPATHYDRGRSRTNSVEAEAVVAEACLRMRSWLKLPAADRPTLGVVTFNSQQQSLIQDLFDEVVREEPGLEWFFEDERAEPTIVKNLENVQGDERDHIFFSITFGTDESGQVPLTLGALNRDGGERRLNVAITRAREQLVVFSSFLPEQLPAERSHSLGVQHLKAFLSFAQRGSLKPANSGRQLDLPPESESDSQRNDRATSDLIAAVEQRLIAKGWDVQSDVGVSGFRISLAVKDPLDRNRFLAAVLCDGEIYHRAPTARDREVTRPDVLGNLGWSVLRVWSRDWWYDPDAATEALHQRLQQLSR